MEPILFDSAALVSAGLMAGVCWSTYFVDIPLVLATPSPNTAALFALYFRRTVRLQQVGFGQMQVLSRDVLALQKDGTPAS